MMRIGGDCYIRGKVNASLLSNLENFCNCWSILKPQTYKKIHIIADEEINDIPHQLNDDAVVSFSGGLDSLLSVYSHFKKLEGRNSKNIKKALFILTEKALREDKNQLEAVLENTKIMLDDLNIELIVIDTNAQFFTVDWLMEHISVFISIISIYKGAYNYGIISSTDRFDIAYDSNNSFSNIFLGSNNFKIITTGEFLTRTQKANIVKNWKIGLEKIRVCNGLGKRDKNCGICNKCQMTMLNFKACGIDNIPAFEHCEVNLDNMIVKKKYQLDYYKEILNYNEINNYLDSTTLNQLINLINRSEKDMNIKNDYDIDILNYKIDKLIDTLAWWIPVRKWRDGFRDKFFR